MTTIELIQYYANLLIFQYLGKPQAYSTIEATVNGFVMPQVSTQQISFSIPPTAGTYTLTYNGNTTSSLNWNASDSQVQTALRALTGLSSVTVSSLLVTFTGITPPAFLLTATSSLTASGSPISITLTETDLVLPLAIQNAFNLTVEPLAQGVQLDTLGKYAGVTRNGNGTNGQPITLNDADFLVLIQMAIIRNNSGSSLSEINNLLFEFFGTEILCVDNANMSLTYLISSVASSNLIQLFITEKLLPAPMGVNVSVIIYAPIVNAFFGFVTYDNPTQPMITRPFNTYDDYHMDWPWFSYGDILT